jgi:hypothetical protein
VERGETGIGTFLDAPEGRMNWDCIWIDLTIRLRWRNFR